MTKNNKNSLVIDMSKTITNATADFYKREFLKNARNLGLSIAGEDIPPVLSGIEEAGMGNLLTVGTADNHDVEWIRRPQFACERGLKPVYDIVDDWNEIQEALVKFYEEKYGLRTKDGAKITIHDGYVKVGYHIITDDTLAEVIARKIVG